MQSSHIDSNQLRYEHMTFVFVIKTTQRGFYVFYVAAAGNSPYPGMQVGSAFYRMIQDGRRMSRPEFSPPEM